MLTGIYIIYIGYMGYTAASYIEYCTCIHLQVFWKRFFSYSSRMDGGTLYQLRNLINRRNVVQDPTSNVTACEDFFFLVVEAHILCATMTYFEMASVEDMPRRSFFPEGSSQLDSSQRRNVLILAIEELLKEFVDIDYNKEQNKDESGVDRVRAYACNILSSGLLLMEFVDAIREGDGSRIIRCWKYFLLHYKVANRTNYSVEAFTLLAQHHFLLSPRLAMQLTWSRTVNIHGCQGKNVPCDLFMEHLNKEAKQRICGLGSNITDESVRRIGRTIGNTIEIAKRFDEDNGIKEPSCRRSRRSCEKDMELLLKQLLEESRVFDYVPNRAHCNYRSMQPNSIQSISIPDLNVWMTQQLHKLVTYHC